MFDQYDLNMIKNNLDKLNNYKYLSSKSDNYSSFTPYSRDSATIPLILLGKNLRLQIIQKKKKKLNLCFLKK